METSIKNSKGVFLIINNIPKDFHASHLRNFFSSFVETGGFVCFHFRHRPEVQKPLNVTVVKQDEKPLNVAVDKQDEKPLNVAVDKQEVDRSRRVTNCCIVKVLPNRANEFIQMYNGEHWLDCKGETLTLCCYIKKISLSEASDVCYSGSSYKKGTIFANLPLEQETFSSSDVESLIEMHPPSFMPNGNVGTKTIHFLNEIRACRLPPSLISKLGLQFPRNRSRRMYGSVPFEYKHKSRNLRYHMPEPPISETTSHKKPWCSRSRMEESTQEEEEEKEESDSEEEEWDRVEALHDDVSGQERNKERLFESKIELKWEKGGSGLVFYTDAQYWDAKDGDFDEKTADDWDIDTRIYEGAGIDTDKDMRDLVRMKLEEKVRDGEETEIDRLYDFAAFEKYTKGFGRKVLEAQGWKQGQGVGRNAAGIAEPLPNDGQRPFDKKGFGYRGEKLSCLPTRIKKRRHRNSDNYEDRVYISTIYDNPKESDPPESVFTSSSFAKLKYRKEFLKEHL